MDSIVTFFLLVSFICTVPKGLFYPSSPVWFFECELLQAFFYATILWFLQYLLIWHLSKGSLFLPLLNEIFGFVMLCQPSAFTALSLFRVMLQKGLLHHLANAFTSCPIPRSSEQCCVMIHIMIKNYPLLYEMFIFPQTYFLIKWYVPIHVSIHLYHLCIIQCKEIWSCVYLIQIYLIHKTLIQLDGWLPYFLSYVHRINIKYWS